MAFFEQAGCPLKIERGQRVFPKSDHSSDIIRALEQTIRKSGVTVLLNTEVKKIKSLPIEENIEGGKEKKQIGKKSKDTVRRYHSLSCMTEQQGDSL